MAAKEKLATLERERTKKEKEKIQAERKRKAAQFLASMKIVSSSNKETLLCNNATVTTTKEVAARSETNSPSKYSELLCLFCSTFTQVLSSLQTHLSKIPQQQLCW